MLLANDQFCFQGLLFLIRLYCHLGHKILLQSHFVGMQLKWSTASTLILSCFPGGIWLMRNMDTFKRDGQHCIIRGLHKPRWWQIEVETDILNETKRLITNADCVRPWWNFDLIIINNSIEGRAALTAWQQGSPFGLKMENFLYWGQPLCFHQQPFVQSHVNNMPAHCKWRISYTGGWWLKNWGLQEQNQPVALCYFTLVGYLP